MAIESWLLVTLSGGAWHGQEVLVPPHMTRLRVPATITDPTTITYQLDTDGIWRHHAN